MTSAIFSLCASHATVEKALRQSITESEDNNTSAYQQQQTKFKDSACLVKALADIGYTQVEVHETPQQLTGYHGDLRAQRANIIVRRQFVGGSSNDLGFIKTEDGTYQAIISDYDLHKHNALWMTSLTKSYAEHGLIKQAKAQGLIFMGKKISAAGKPQLQFAVR